MLHTASSKWYDIIHHVAELNRIYEMFIIQDQTPVSLVHTKTMSTACETKRNSMKAQLIKMKDIASQLNKNVTTALNKTMQLHALMYITKNELVEKLYKEDKENAPAQPHHGELAARMKEGKQVEPDVIPTQTSKRKVDSPVKGKAEEPGALKRKKAQRPEHLNKIPIVHDSQMF